MDDKKIDDALKSAGKAWFARSFTILQTVFANSAGERATQMSDWFAQAGAWRASAAKQIFTANQQWRTLEIIRDSSKVETDARKIAHNLLAERQG